MSNPTNANMLQPDPAAETVCHVEEEDVPPADEVNASNFRQSEMSAITTDLNAQDLDPEEQQNLETVAESLPQDDINKPPVQDVEVPYDQKVAPVPVPIVIDEGLPESVHDNIPNDVSKTSARSNDQCCSFRCCGFPNGVGAILFGQFFLLCGVLACTSAMFDCAFIEATAGFPETSYIDALTPNVDLSWLPTGEVRRGFGFVFNETEEGGCNYEEGDHRTYQSETFTNYQDFLGSDWDIPRILSGIALVIAWVFLICSVTLWCCSYIKPLRRLTGTVLFLVVGGFQCSAFAVIGSSFCKVEGVDCEPARGFWVCLAGVICYLIAAICFCVMSDYPGAEAY